MSATDVIKRTLKETDNEGTSEPYWILIDPERCHMHEDHEERNPDDILHMIANCIEGPFFSREDAEEYLKRRHYNYSKHAKVYCHSGYWSKKWKALWKEIEEEKRSGREA